VTVIVVIVICFFAVTTGLRAVASKRSTGRWRYRGMFKYRPDRWENRNTALWSSGVTDNSDEHASPHLDSGDSGRDDGGGA
jgi:nitrate reductase beta subunit